MKYYLAEIEDKFTHYNIKAIVPCESDTLFSKDNYLPLSLVAHDQINEAIQNDQMVTIQKPIYSNEVMPCDLNITDQDPIAAYRDAYLIKIKTLVTPEITKESGYTMYEFMMMHTKMMDKGYFIHDDNREEKYIEIIETEDEQLIELLESYLEAKDKISRAYFLKDKYDKLVKSTKNMKTQDEIENVCQNFIKEYF